MRLTNEGRALIKSFEGLSLKAYPDPPGDPQGRHSIGYGHSGARPGDVITRDEADRLFDGDAIKYEAAVSTTTPNAAQHEFDAMTSLAYNIGTGGFASSTVARKHNMGDRLGAADAFLLWNKAGGQVHPGLVARRKKEREIYLNGHYASGSFPAPVPNQTPIPPEPIAQSSPSTSPSGWPEWALGIVPTSPKGIGGVVVTTAAAALVLYLLSRR